MTERTDCVTDDNNRNMKNWMNQWFPFTSEAAVTVEKTTSNIGDNVARYTLKQGGNDLTNGVINIPKVLPCYTQEVLNYNDQLVNLFDNLPQNCTQRDINHAIDGIIGDLRDEFTDVYSAIDDIDDSEVDLSLPLTLINDPATTQADYNIDIKNYLDNRRRGFYNSSTSVSSLPAASDSTMGFIGVVSNSVDDTDGVYTVRRTSGSGNNYTYSWVKICEVDAPADVSELTDAYDTPFTPKSHTHNSGDISFETAIRVDGSNYDNQEDYNIALLNKISSINGCTVVNSLPTASGSTSGIYYDKYTHALYHAVLNMGNHTFAWEDLPISSSKIYVDSGLANIPITEGQTQDAVNQEIDNLLGNLSSDKVGVSDVANNLTTTTSGKVLDARQGKVLADLIGDAITYINQ